MEERLGRVVECVIVVGGERDLGAYLLNPIIQVMVAE